jgi:predicted metal-dependent hydrolase
MFKKNILNFVEKHKQWINKQVNEHKNKKIVSKTEVTKMKKQAKKYILDRVIKIASDYGFEYNKIRITSAKTRW